MGTTMRFVRYSYGGEGGVVCRKGEEDEQKQKRGSRRWRGEFYLEFSSSCKGGVMGCGENR